MHKQVDLGAIEQRKKFVVALTAVRRKVTYRDDSSTTKNNPTVLSFASLILLHYSFNPLREFGFSRTKPTRFHRKIKVSFLLIYKFY